MDPKDPEEYLEELLDLSGLKENKSKIKNLENVYAQCMNRIKASKKLLKERRNQYIEKVNSSEINTWSKEILIDEGKAIVKGWRELSL